VNGTSFGARLTALAEADPDRPALTCDGVTLSRAALLARTRGVAAHLAGHGVERGSLVSVVLPNSIELIETLLAIWWLGATPQPISDRLPAAERATIIDLGRPTLVISTTDEGLPHSPVVHPAALVASDLDARSTIQPAVSPCWKIMNSGGSTGRPKLIVAEQAAVPEDLDGFGDFLALPADGCVLVTGPMSHNAPFVITTLSLLRGSHVVLMQRFDAVQALDLVQRHRVGWLYLVPTMMLRIWRLSAADRDARDLTSLRVAYHMAAPCPPWLKEAWIDWLGPETIWELYGGTESQAMTVITGKEWLLHRGSVGRAVIGEVEARDDEGNRLEPGAVGELWMRRGVDEPTPYRYIGATARAAGEGWESLGDIGYLDDDDYVYITDRRADMILIGGSNVYPAEIEAALDEHPAVHSCCVIGLPDEELGQVPHAIVELAEPVDDADLLAHVRDRLASYKVPRSFERVEQPLRDDAGKVRRSALQAARVPGPGA
jgi:bile acid-coenzyme A ligase